MQFKKKLWIGIIILAILTPIGVLLPEKFNASDAWGEWSAETIGKMIGFVPEKLKQNAELWKAPVPDYNFGSEESPLSIQIISYISSGLIGIGIAAVLMFGIKKILIKNDNKRIDLSSKN